MGTRMIRDSARKRNSRKTQAKAVAVPGDLPKIPIATHSFDERYLYAFATQGEVIQHLRTQALKEDRDSLPEVMEAWNRVQGVVVELVQREAGMAETIRVAPIPDAYHGGLKMIGSDPLFQRTFHDLPFTFEILEIDKLIAAQRTVHLGYVDRLLAAFPKSPNLADLIDICLSPKRKMDPIQHLEVGPNTHVFSSPNSDLRFLGSFVKDLAPDDMSFASNGGLPAAAIITFIGYGGAPINVLKAGNRIVLNNGFHRVFALRSLGVTEIPVLVQHVHNPQLEFPRVVAGLPMQYLLQEPRPALMKDFFEPDFAITLRVQERIRLVTVGVNTAQHDVPS